MTVFNRLLTFQFLKRAVEHQAVAEVSLHLSELSLVLVSIAISY